jgi:hypothetical protein
MVRHYTVSGIVLHDDRVLPIEHRKSGTALPPGGHINPEKTRSRRCDARSGRRSASTWRCWPTSVSAIRGSGSSRRRSPSWSTVRC